MDKNCTGCVVSAGTHKPAEAMHQIAEPKSEALRIADALDDDDTYVSLSMMRQAAAELRAQNARIAELESQLQHAAKIERAAILLRIKNRASAGALLVKDFEAIVNDRSPVQAAAPAPDEHAEFQKFIQTPIPNAFYSRIYENWDVNNKWLGWQARAALAATQPAAQGMDADGMYYLQDARHHAMVGNCPSFWRPDGNGYTTNLDEAARFTFEDAMQQHQRRKTDLPWLCSEVDKLRRPTVDCQDMPRSWDAQRAALAAQAKQVGAA